MGTAISSSGEVVLLDRRQCSSSPTVGLSLKSGRGTTMIGIANIGQCLMPHARDRSGTRRTTRAQDTAHPTRASPDVDTATVWETLSVSAVENPLSENSPFLQINSLFPYFRWKKVWRKISLDRDPIFSKFLWKKV